jgi:hypothetical protein
VREDNVAFKTGGIEWRKERNEEENEEAEWVGVVVVRHPINTWGSSWGGRPVPFGNLVIFFTLINSR